MQKLSLTGFELYKLFSRKSVWISLGLMVLIVYLPLQLITGLNGRNYQGYYQQSPPTAQQVLQAKTDLKQVEANMRLGIHGSGEYLEFQRGARDQAIVDSGQGSVIQSTIDQLNQTIANLETNGSTGFLYRMYSLQYSMMRHLPFIGGGYYNGGPEIAVDFFKTFGFIIFGGMILFGLSSVFSEEYAIGTDSFLLTTKRGRREVTTAKLLASMLYVCVIACILLGVNLVSNLSLFGVKGFSFPLQSIPLYSAPFHLSIWQYITVATLIQMLGGISFGFFVLLLSSLTRFSLVSFFISTGIFVLPEFIIRLYGHTQWAQTVMQFSYTGLTQVSGLFTIFIAYNLFGYPVLYPIIVIALAMLISIPFIWLIYFAFRKHQVV